nr:hypothetical protein [Tanacetum cinerariifolium]
GGIPLCIDFQKPNNAITVLGEVTVPTGSDLQPLHMFVSIYISSSRTLYKSGNMVIIHIDYDYALDVLIYLMVDESDKNDDIKKKKLSLEQQETKQNTDIENKNKGMPSSKKMDLRRGQCYINVMFG